MSRMLSKLYPKTFVLKFFVFPSPKARLLRDLRCSLISNWLQIVNFKLYICYEFAQANVKNNKCQKFLKQSETHSNVQL